MVVKIIIGPIQKVWHSKTRNLLPPFPMLHLVIFHFESLPPGAQQVTDFELKIGRLWMRTEGLIFAKMSIFSTQNVSARWTTTSENTSVGLLPHINQF